MYKKIAFIGGDKRMFHCASSLYDRDYECALYGFDRISDRTECTRCASIRDATVNCFAAVLPTPISRDGIRLCCDGASITLEELFEAIPKDAEILGGAISEKVYEKAKKAGRVIHDYLLDESLVEKNAYLTAEGAVSLIMQSTERSLMGMCCLISGYGRIGKYTARLLSLLGADVTVLARRERSRTMARLCGHNAFTYDEAGKHFEASDIIINTVPETVFGKRELSAVKHSRLYLELASSPGGIDKSEAALKNVEIMDGSSLPTRYCPESAGKFIAETLCDIFEDEVRI